MNKLSSRIKILLIYIAFAAALFHGCSKEKSRTDFIARVDDSYLTKEELAADLDLNNLQKSRREEYIRNWIETELLYKEALKEDIDKEDEYIRAVEKSKRELAKAFLIKKISESNNIEIEKQEIEEFYGRSKRDFELFTEHYLYNIITFNNEDKAILFRSTLIESDWNKATNVFKGEPSIIYEKEKEFQDINQINPSVVLVMLKELLHDEVSIVLNTGSNSYTVIQLIKKYNTGEIPELEVIKNRVIDRLTMIKTKELIENYVKDLYTKYHIEIK